jgi:hypothetical protein
MDAMDIFIPAGRLSGNIGPHEIHEVIRLGIPDFRHRIERYNKRALAVLHGKRFQFFSTSSNCWRD